MTTRPKKLADLHDDRLVEAHLDAERFAQLGRGERAEQHRRRVARDELDGADQHDQRHRGDDRGKPDPLHRDRRATSLPTRHLAGRSRPRRGARRAGQARS